MYAVLEKDGDFHRVERIVMEKPESGLYIKCRPSYYYDFSGPDAEHQKVYVDYRLDRYFVMENSGAELDELSRDGKLTARVKVFNGYPLLIEVFSM